MIHYRSEEEIDLIRESSLLVAKTHAEMSALIIPGVTTLQLDAIAEEFIRDNGGVPAFKGYGGFPNTLCSSLNDQVVHGIPNDKPLNDGDIISIYDKIHMFDITLKNGESYKESDFYSPGSELKITKVLGHSVGHTICYDLRYPKLYRALAKKGSQIIVVPSAFTHTTGKAHWHSLIKARAIENGVFILAPNQWGVNNEKRVTYGHTLIVDPWGETLAEAEDGEMIIAAELDLNRVRECQNAIPVLDNDINFD